MDFQLPELGEGVYEAELVDWRVQPGDVVKRGQPLMEVLTDKATMEVPAPFAGTVTALHAEPGKQIKVGQAVLAYTPAGADAEKRPDAQARRRPDAEARRPKEADAGRPNGGVTVTAAARPAGATSAALRVPASPSVRYLARKMGVDLAGVPGSGPQGRILLDDLSAFLQQPPTLPSPARGGGEGGGPKLDVGKPGSRLKLAGLRRKVAEHMVLSKQTIPHYSYIDECDVTDLVRLRAQLKEPFARQGVKLTYLPFLVKAAVAALKEVPLVNATLDEAAGEIVLHERYHIGVAVAVPGGLVVPVVHDADQKDLATLARELERLSAEARTGKIKLDDLRGGTFTITSIGSIGGLISTPIINHPEVGILGVGKMVKRPVFDPAGNVRPADIVYLSLSLDHRVVDGAIGAVFGNALIKQLQAPAALLL